MEISLIQTKVPFNLSWGLVAHLFCLPFFVKVGQKSSILRESGLQHNVVVTNGKKSDYRPLNGAKLQLKWTDDGGNLEGEWKEQALRIRPTYLQSWLQCYYHSTVLNLSYLTRKWVMYIGNGNPLQYSCLENPMDRGA